MTTDKHYFIELNAGGKFAVRAKGSQRASRLCDTQKQAEAVVKKLNSDDKPNVERVRNTKTGHRDQCDQSDFMMDEILIRASSSSRRSLWFS